MQEAKAQEFLDLVQGEMSMIEHVVKFLQLSRFGMYLILNEEKKGKKSELPHSDHDELFQHSGFVPVGR